MAEWLKGATLVEDSPSWLKSAVPVSEGAFENLGSQFVAGIGDNIAGKAQTAQELGATTVGPAVQQAADTLLRQGVSDPYQRFKQPAPGDTTIGDYSLNAIPGVIARGAGSIVTELPAAALGRTAMGVSGAATAFGPELDERRRRNNGELGMTDYAIAGGSAALQGALNALGLSSIIKGVKAPANGVVGATGRVAQAAGIEGATNAGQNVVSEVATNVGTKNNELTPKSLQDAAVLGAVQGVGTGGGLRAGYEVGRVPRAIATEINMRNYEHRDVLPAMSADLQKIASDNGLDIAKRSDAAKAFGIFESNLTKHKETADKAVEAELNKQVKEGTLTQTERDKALAALKTPNKEGFDILEQRVGREPFGVDAMELAKRASMASVAKRLSGLTDSSATEVSGPLDKGAKRLIGAATGAAAGAVLPTSFMSSIQSSGLAAVMASGAHVAPIVGGAIAGYMGLRALDKALGTYNPINQLVEGGAKRGATSALPGEGLESPRALKELKDAKQMQAQADALKAARFTNLQLRNDALAQQMQLRPTVVQAQNAQRQAAAAKTQAQADAVPILAQATADLTQARAENLMSKTELNKVKAEIETLKKQKLAAADKADKDTLTAQIKNLEEAVRKAQTQKGTAAPVGQAQSSEPTVRKGPIDRKAEKIYSFESVLKREAPDEAATIMSLLDDLKLKVNNFEDGYDLVTKAANASKSKGDFIMNWWVKPGAELKDTNLGKLFSYKDGKKIGVIMTRDEAEARRFGIAAE